MCQTRGCKRRAVHEELWRRLCESGLQVVPTEWRSYWRWRCDECKKKIEEKQA